ncbi:uncharacterized protein LOC130994839 [Salvia miltiorrhiza]|uniref:uncharacterized protein LOC130994839 n=1 Tax=Salvia miltiorrhiza TaxID=226208 RepID=UPI0025AB717C|nr:uncharacterized protein LOC130994839 [Salvia miltiorrhiza]XP_057775918.1 uncharacterized protein LOC130994839 [Salvia miltiorrhiza]XP_057775919.1 uncharacterized protein LOC130994839 [Salvia miltiorrhiza]XP_057775920.1 uncharacterized protein LOC130994839 [Salvia miltiorrhiza]
MDLDFDKYCLVDGSPTTVLPVPRPRSCVAGRKPSGKREFGNETPSPTEFEIDFGDYCSGSCRDVRSQRISGEVLKRGSVYQSSKEAKLIQETDAAVGRKKIEFSPRTASSLSIEIIESLCNSDEESSVMSFSEQSTASGYANGVEFCYDDSTEEASSPRGKDVALSLHGPLSARFGLPHSPANSGRDSSRASSSSRGRFSHVRNMLDPFVKSKSRRSPLCSFNKTHGETTSGRPMLGDIFEKPHHVEYDHQYEEKKETHNSVPRCSPAHLHGLLKMGSKHGAPFFQFSVKSPEDFYVAKTWKVENASTWIYTFHVFPNRRKRGASGWGLKECSRESSMVGWMQVSCHLHTEFEGAGQSNDSMMTEFVLYDVLHSRKSIGDTGQFMSSKLHPELEIAAIIMQAPLEKRESLKFKSGDKKIDETSPNLLDHCRVVKAKEGVSDTSNPGKMHVVIPAGNHSLPASGSRGPSPLLDRWRSGGGCDCGGWDMACPLSVFTNKIAEEHRTELFVQGRRDNTPAFTMRVIEGGKYAVDFHAQLSSLQAFSICVAILHAAEASPTGRERSKPMLQSDALKVYTEEEIKTMLDAIAKEEKSKVKKIEQAVPSFVLSPPFSPIARV